MLLEVVDKAMEGEANAKGLEVALKAIAKLGEAIEDTSLNARDEDIKNKLPAEVLRVVKRNAARRVAARAGKVSKGDGKEVDHKQPLSRGGGNGKGNLRVTSRSANRRKGTRSS